MAWFVESLLADRLGLTRKALEDFRKSELKKEGDWKKENRHVLLAHSSVKKLLHHLGAENLDYSACAQKNGADPPQLVELAVTRLFPNPRLIEARNPETGQVVRVAVKSSVNFRPRMMIKARRPPVDGPQLYRLEGRTPRFPGRW